MLKVHTEKITQQGVTISSFYMSSIFIDLVDSYRNVYRTYVNLCMMKVC